MPRGGSRTKGKKIKYPKHRASPAKHTVKAHKRRGKRVKKFQRGKVKK